MNWPQMVFIVITIIVVLSLGYISWNWWKFVRMWLVLVALMLLIVHWGEDPKEDD